MLYNTFGRVPKGWELIANKHYNSIGYEVYEDDNEQYWYMPVITEQCDECHGSGTDPDEEEETCWICDGDGWVNIRLTEKVLSEDEYQSDIRQRRWLEKRYGYIPQHIADFWQFQADKRAFPDTAAYGDSLDAENAPESGEIE